MAAKPVVVGVDGSEESLRAVEWAALEARRHSAPLRIVSAPALVPRMHAPSASPEEIACALRGIAAQALDAAITRSEEVAPGLPLTTGLLSGPPPLAVAESGAEASMLVVGARGAGGFAAMVLGSVSRYVASRAPCPVVVVREENMAVHREIAVGVRDPQDTGAALAFAFEEAALRDANLVAVHTWYWYPSARIVPRRARCRPTWTGSRPRPPAAWPPRWRGGARSTRACGSARTSSTGIPPGYSPATPPGPISWYLAGTAIRTARAWASARSSTRSSTTFTGPSRSSRRVNDLADR